MISPFTTVRPLTGASAMSARMFSTRGALVQKKATAPGTPVYKKGLSGYNIFLRDFMAANVDKIPNGVTALAPRVGSEWNNLPSSTKDEYSSRAVEARDASEDANMAIWKSATAETKAAYRKASGKKFPFPGGLKAYNKYVDEKDGNPGRPIGPYIAFCSEAIKTGKVTVPAGVVGSGRMIALAKESSYLWQKLSEAEKKVYKDNYMAAKTKFLAWKATQPDLQ